MFQHCRNQELQHKQPVVGPGLSELASDMVRLALNMGHFKEEFPKMYRKHI